MDESGKSKVAVVGLAIGICRGLAIIGKTMAIVSRNIFNDSIRRNRLECVAIFD